MKELIRKHLSSIIKPSQRSNHSAAQGAQDAQSFPRVEVLLPEPPADAPRVLVIGAGSRGNAYARAIFQQRNGIVAAVAEPDPFKRQQFGRRYIWGEREPRPGEAFADWREFVEWVKAQKKGAGQQAGANPTEGQDGEGEKEEYKPIDAACICIQDRAHKDAVLGLAPLGMHILCEKPLATSLEDCLDIYYTVRPNGVDTKPTTLFGICHVLRYNPHNMMLRKLLHEDQAIGEIISIEHTEPVGNWHFSHSYVRGNWRNSSTSSPSLLAKSCHDIDLLLWLLGSPPNQPVHEPALIASTGSLNMFKRSRKPAAAGSSTNCLSCPIERTCMYSAKRLYYDNNLARGSTGWPVKIVVPDLEDTLLNKGRGAAAEKLLGVLGEDYEEDTPKGVVAGRNWFGRCVWECDNDVCDDQFVTISWDDEEPVNEQTSSSPSTQPGCPPRRAKTAVLHMVAGTYGMGGRRGRIYGTHGEIAYDSETIRVMSFVPPEPPVAEDSADGSGGSFKMPGPTTRPIQTYRPASIGGHGGGDEGIVQQFIAAVAAVKSGDTDVQSAQDTYLGCTIEDVVRSHAVVWAAESARTSKSSVDWKLWWQAQIAAQQQPSKGP